MKTFIKTIKTMTAVLMIIAGLVALFTVDNAESITTLIAFAVIMVLGVAGGIYLLYSTYPELADLSEFEEADKRVFEEYDIEIDELREEKLLLIDRYLTFKSILKAKGINSFITKEKYPNLYSIVYEEDLVGEGTKLQEPSLEQIDRFKEIYN